MIADPLTKAMSCERLSKMLSTGILDLNPTQESLIIKAKNKLLRKKAKEAKKPKEDSADADNEDIDLNIAWRSEEDNEDVISDDNDIDTNARLMKAINEMEKAMEFIEAMKRIKKMKDSDIAKMKEIAKQNRQRNGDYRCQ